MRKRLEFVGLDWRKEKVDQMEVIQGKDAKEAAAGPEKGDDAVDHETEIDEGTETDGAGHGKEQAIQETVEEIEADLEKEEGIDMTVNFIICT